MMRETDMQDQFHSFSELFSQLGLDADADAIENFLSEHSPLDDNIELADAPFWNNAQAQFLREALSNDSDWAEMVDALNLALR
jgi:hypothetical protein